jgi:hypothetical protein
VAQVVLDLAIFDRSVAVCGELGVPDQLRKLVLKEYRSPADRYSKLRGQFEQACQSFKKAEQAVLEVNTGGVSNGGMVVGTLRVTKSSAVKQPHACPQARPKRFAAPFSLGAHHRIPKLHQSRCRGRRAL